MKILVGRFTSGIAVAGGWVLLGARTMLDLIGYSTIPEDVAVAKTRLDQALGLLFSVPWWAIFAFCLASTLWLIWVSWPKQDKRIPIAAKPDTNQSGLVSFGVKKQLDNSNLADGDFIADIVRFEFWVKNIGTQFRDGCRLKVSVSSLERGAFERRFNGNLHAGETEFIFGFEVRVHRSPKWPEIEHLQFRREPVDVFEKMPALIDLQFSFSALDMETTEKSFYVTGILSAADYILIGDDNSQRDYLEAFAYS